MRILDTRTDVGLPGPFVSAVSQKFQVTGSAVPAGATGVLLNVTVVTPTANGFLSIRPGDATGAPSTSSLNVNAGDIVPNAVQVGLPTAGANAGQIDITFDAYGQAGPATEVLIDVVGYLVAGGGGTPGPSGATGATGPAGPGAQLIDVPVPQDGITVTIGTFGGVRIRAVCSSTGVGLYFDLAVGGSGNNLRMGGIAHEKSVPRNISFKGFQANITASGPIGPLHYSGLIENLAVNEPYQVEIHLSPTNPCEVWGSLIPLN
ncbi:MAG TPA: hypothetical protein VES40_08350 [Ilumatobacteraceae bacterium]|nr:hypothetical protein [Ilumatobacteraceae bacterium]